MDRSCSRANRSTILIAILAALAAASPLHAAHVPSRFVPGDAAVAPAVGNQTAPFLCQGASTVLSVWSDNRAKSTGGYEGETSWDVYGMRFDAAGSPLDALPIPIAVGRASQQIPRAAWNGTHWLVVYESYDLTGTGYYYQKSLEAVRVAPDGHVVDAKPIKIYNVTPTGGTWAVASDGSKWVVAIQGTSASGDIVALRISSSGALVDASPRSLVPGTYYQRGGFHLAYAAGVFLLAYEESMTGYDPTSAIRFDGALNLIDPAPYNLAGTPLSRLVSNGSGFYAVWNEQLPDWTMAVKGSRIGTNGQRLDGAGVNISGPNEPQPCTSASVAWDGANWKITWGSSSGMRLARVSTAGQVLDPGGVPVSGPKTGLTASAGNGSLQVVWEEYVTSNSEVLSAFVNSANVPGPNRTLSIGAPSQTRVDLAANGSGYMMIYRSSTASRSRILAQPLDAAGNPLTAEPVELDAADSPNEPGSPAVAWNGTVYLATWSNAGGVVARRLQPNGTPLEPAPFLVMNPGFGPADVEALGGDFLVVGLRCGINCQYVFPIAGRVRGSDGVVVDSSPIQMGGTFCSNPRLAALGERWLLVWQANASHDNPAASTLGTFIDAAGAKVPDFTVHGGYSTAGGNGIFSIGLASSGNVALMVQSQELTSGVETDVLGRLIDPNGAVHPMIHLTPWEGDQYRPKAAWDGSQFVVVWQDQETALSDWSLEQLDARSDLMGMRVMPTGAIVDPQGFVVSNSPIGEAYPNVASAGGTTLIAGSLVRNDAPWASYRIGYELLGSSGNAWPVPIASASPAEGDVPLAVDFSSLGTTDPDGAVAAYLWDFGDGTTSIEANPTHSYTVGGPYVATLTATDDRGARSVQQVLVKAVEPNLAPVAVVSSNITGGAAPLDVTFYARGSYDPDGFIGNVQWTFSDGGDYWGTTAYHTFYQQGTWQVTMTVYDARGATGTDSLTINVGPTGPPAAPSNLVAIAFTSDWINMTWTDSSNNEDGFKVERCQGAAAYCVATPAAWSEIAQTGANTDYHGDTGLPSETTFSYRVRAFNGTAHSGYSNTSTATTESAPPVAEFVASVLNGPAPLLVQFDGSGSHDPDGSIASFAWEFGDGSTGSGATVSHTYTVAGMYYPRLTVTDNSGATSSALQTIVVKTGNTPGLTSGDGSTPMGAIAAGSHLDTRTQNDVAEVLIETATSGSPSTRKSMLEHTWILDVASGRSQTFYLDAWHSANTEGDDFVFEYSRDNASWTPMVTVTKTSDNDALQAYTFTQEVTGQLFVRVRDLDRTPGRDRTDTVSVDEMLVMARMSWGYSGEVAPLATDEPASELTVSKGLGDTLLLAWGPSCVSTDIDFAVYQGPIGDFTAHAPVLCSTGEAASAMITPGPGSSYYLVVPSDQYYEGRYGVSSSGTDIPAGPTRCWPAALATGCP